jgi:hypothetical protein
MDLTSMTERHVIDVEETNDEYIVAFAKAQEVAEEPEEREVEEVETRDLPVQTKYRTGSVRMMDEESDRRVMMSISSTNPVESEFGYEVLRTQCRKCRHGIHVFSGKAPLLLTMTPDSKLELLKSIHGQGQTQSASPVQQKRNGGRSLP